MKQATVNLIATVVSVLMLAALVFVMVARSQP